MQAIDEAFRLLPPKTGTYSAKVMLLAIGLQESRLEHRRQLVGKPPRPTGPAMGLWQFERGGGVAGVLRHAASRALAEQVCKARGVAPTPSAVWGALRRDDVLAACFARLLLWTDPKPLPEVGEVEVAWRLYLRTWRPGAYDRGSPEQRGALRKKWADNYARALMYG